MMTWNYIPETFMIGGSDFEGKKINLKHQEDKILECEITIVNSTKDEMRVKFSLEVSSWQKEEQGIGSYEYQGQRGVDSQTVLIPSNLILSDLDLYLVVDEYRDPHSNIFDGFDEVMKKEWEEMISKILLNEVKIKISNLS